MNDKLLRIGQKLISTGKLETSEYEYLIDNRNDEIADFLKSEAIKKRKEVYDNTVFIRGLIEISNICKNDCLYCGIRASNKDCDRYRLTKDEILSCCEEGYSLGVPQAIRCVLEATDFEDAIRNAVSLGGDSDTLACIAGSIAEPLFGVPQAMYKHELNILKVLFPKLQKLLVEFEKKYGNRVI